MELNAVLFSYLQDCAQGMIKLMSPLAVYGIALLGIVLHAAVNNMTNNSAYTALPL